MSVGEIVAISARSASVLRVRVEQDESAYECKPLEND